MKNLIKLNIAIILLLSVTALRGQETEKPEPSVNIQYFNVNGSLQYLKLKVLVKLDNRLQPVPAAPLSVYLDDESQEYLLGKVKTDEKGEVKIAVPSNLKDKWISDTTTHKFIAVYTGSKSYAASTSELEIAKAKIVLDTLNEDGTRQVKAQVLAYQNGNWEPVKDVELKIGVERLGGQLKIGEEESYTTDSTGTATGEFKLDKLPSADQKNNIVLVARTEDNEQYGNLIFNKQVPWGQYVKAESNFGQRSLWATRDKAPIWLLLLANAILLGVWSVLIYLLVQIRRMKKAVEPTISKPVLTRTMKVEEVSNI
jgi:hypothetical protein